MTNGGEQTKNLRELVMKGEEISVKQYRSFVLSAIIEIGDQQKVATQERKDIQTLMDEKIQCLEDKIPTAPLACKQAEDNLEEINRIRDTEIPDLRKATRITDAIVLAVTAALGYFGIK